MTHPGGRPSKLTSSIADLLVAELERGANLADAAASTGIADRTLRSWRERAWSKVAADAPFVELEQRVQVALRQSQRAPDESVAEEPWQAIARRLADNDPARWGSPCSCTAAKSASPSSNVADVVQ
jgi:hypothetical protein